jgi:peptidyl-prolyl cis-trans isomerase B (cyclophilin B)
MRLALPLLMLLPVLASAQIEPVQLYNGIRRPFFVKVRAPGGDAKVEIQALTPVTAVPLYSAVVEAGKIDVAKALPDLWTTKRPRLLYLQLLVDGKKRGPALVLQPMTVPDNSRLAADGKTVEFVPDEDQEFAGYRAYVDQHLVFETSMGRMEFRLRPDCAPNTAFNIMEFARNGLYTETIWHRVVAKRKDGTPFVIQGGDPAGTGSGGPGFSFKDENLPKGTSSSTVYKRGTVAMANSGPNTNGSQFFLVYKDSPLPPNYSVWGQITSGLSILDQISGAGVAGGGADGSPNQRVVISRASVTT